MNSGSERGNMSRAVAVIESESVWWLEEGSDWCRACGHSYVFETGYYCVDCDSGLCSICIESARGWCELQRLRRSSPARKFRWPRQSGKLG
jgi:hypothetical protein